jgi:hypothetical protein
MVSVLLNVKLLKADVSIQVPSFIVASFTLNACLMCFLVTSNNMDRRSRSTSLRKDHIRHVTISSSSSSSRSRSRNRNRNRSRSLSSRSRSRSGSRRRSRRRRRSKKRRRSSSKSRSKSRSKSKSKSRRSRSLSSSKNELKRTGYLGTNSRDPKMVASRIFIGNLPMSDVSKEDLEAIYGRYGKILG